MITRSYIPPWYTTQQYWGCNEWGWLRLGVRPCPVSDGSPMAPCPIRSRNRANHAHVEIEIGPQTLQGTPCSGRQFFSPSLTTS